MKQVTKTLAIHVEDIKEIKINTHNDIAITSKEQRLLLEEEKDSYYKLYNEYQSKFDEIDGKINEIKRKMYKEDLSFTLKLDKVEITMNSRHQLITSSYSYNNYDLMKVIQTYYCRKQTPSYLNLKELVDDYTLFLKFKMNAESKFTVVRNKLSKSLSLENLISYHEPNMYSEGYANTIYTILLGMKDGYSNPLDGYFLHLEDAWRYVKDSFDVELM